MRYLITLSVEGLEAAADTVAAARRYFEKHPEFRGVYVYMELDEQVSE